MRIITVVFGLVAALFLTACAPIDEPTAVQPAETKAAGGAKKAKPTPIKLTATKTPYRRAEFATGGPYSCAKVTVTNQTEGNVEVNPYGFAVTGVDGEKRQAAVGVAKGEFDALTLAPGEKASGTVCAETKVAPKVVTFSEGLGETARAEVA